MTVLEAIQKSAEYLAKKGVESPRHFGVFLDGVMHGAMSYGSSIDKRKTIGLVKGTLFKNKAKNATQHTHKTTTGA